MTLKDDNLGLGARGGAKIREGQCTGLDNFQDVLGRLNGKNPMDVEKEQTSRESVRRAIYKQNRWGSQRFVSGGLLVGDRVQRLPEKTVEESSFFSNTELQCHNTLIPTEAESEGARGGAPEQVGGLSSVLSNGNLKRQQRPKQQDNQASGDELALGTRLIVEEEPQSRLIGQDDPVPPNTLASSSATKAQRRLEKAERKLKRKSRRGEKHLSSIDGYGEPAVISGRSTSQHCPLTPNEGLSKLQEGLKVRGEVLLPTRNPASGRHAVRQRYIQHKKMAMIDTRALNEV